MNELDRVYIRLQQRVASEALVVACFVSGSVGKRTHDPFSDLDVALVFRDGYTREQAYRERRSFGQSILPYVPAKSFDANHVRPHFHIILFSNGVKVDLRYETVDLEPNPWDREIRILKDNAGWAERFQAASAALALPKATITDAMLTDLDNRFWVMFWDVTRLIKRGDSSKPYPIYLQLLHFTIPQLLSLLPPEHQAYQGLLQTGYSREAKATLAHLRQLLDAYLKAREAIIQRHHLLFTPNHPFEMEMMTRLNG
ncbi:MAG: aminoglycoside 6-adenylyltransferase [Anaerolineae bacterium]|nr:aminoglycoside 6-adenylyltransferase [Anaerolineae bacterium]